MSTQPSKHAMRAAAMWLYSDQSLKFEDAQLAAVIDEHAIAHAVAERDKRIAELEQSVQLREDEHLVIVSKLHEADKRIEELGRQLNSVRLICGTTNANKFETVVDRQQQDIAELEESVSHLRAECLRLSRENIELRRGAPLEKVISPDDVRVTDYTD